LHQLVSSATIVLACSSVALGQTRSADQPRVFEAASVKPNLDTRGRPTAFVPPSGQVVFTHHSLLDLINYAYGLRAPYQLAALPDWARQEQYDIRGVLPASVDGSNEAPRLMQILLAERFKLRVHREMKDTDVYQLVLVQPEHPGPGLTQSLTGNCAAFFATGATLGSPDVPRDENGQIACGTSIAAAPASALRITMLGVAMSEATQRIEQWGGLGRPLSDGTGLSGTWNARLQFSPMQSTVSASLDAPFIESALREQLGLRLVSKRELRPVLIVDSVSRPTPD
jgi:uncharacterized protein (TIGR03435 family)